MSNSKYYISCTGGLYVTIYDKTSGIPPVLLEVLGVRDSGEFMTRLIK